MKLSELMELYDLKIMKDINGNFYIKDAMNYFKELKKWKSVGSHILNVIEAIPDSLIQEELNDIGDGLIPKDLKYKCYEDGYNYEENVGDAINFLEHAKSISDDNILHHIIDSKLTLLKSFWYCKFEDDITPQFLTKEFLDKNHKFEIVTQDLGQGCGYKANYNCKWEEIPNNAVLYVPESCIAYDKKLDIEYAANYYTKQDLENIINNYEMTGDHYITAETLLNELSYESPEIYLDGLDYNYIGLILNDVDVEM